MTDSFRMSGDCEQFIYSIREGPGNNKSYYETRETRETYWAAQGGMGMQYPESHTLLSPLRVTAACSELDWVWLRFLHPCLSTCPVGEYWPDNRGYDS